MLSVDPKKDIALFFSLKFDSQEKTSASLSKSAFFIYARVRSQWSLVAQKQSI